MKLKDKLELLKSGKMTAVQNAKSFLDKISRKDKKINSFIDIRLELALNRAKYLDTNREKLKNGKLFGICVAVKSAINVRGYNISCASNTLKDYIGTYNATVINKIEQEGGIVIGMTNCDEFCSGVSGETSAFGATQNPASFGDVPGGSSSGSAAAVAAGFCDAALGSDTGGSIRVPASFCGVVGVKPSYGCVSRYGLVDLAMSLDQIGPLARNVEDAALVLDVIKGRDERDTTSFDSGKIKLDKAGKITLGIVKVKGVNNKIQELVDKFVNKLVREKGWSKKEVEIKHIELALETYHPIVWTEFFSATRRFDGRKYGKKIEDAAGAEVLRRIFGGSEISRAEFEGRYYHKALEVKNLIKQEFEHAFGEVDCLLMPTVAVLPWKIGEKKTLEEYYAVDSLVIPANLAEACAVSVSIGKIDGKPVGMQVICSKGSESKMLNIGKEIECESRQ